MFDVSKNIEEYKSDLQELINLFELSDYSLTISCENISQCFIEIDFNGKILKYTYPKVENNNSLIFDRELKHNIKSSLYKTLSKECNEKLSWGSLTGVRPARLVYNKLDEGYSFEKAIQEVKKEYFLSGDKAELLKNTVQNQLKVIKIDNSYCLYIHIPICPTRCIYCSFVSTDFTHAKEYLNEYVDYLIKEVDYTLNLIETKNIKINSVYIGGGTPSVLSAEQLKNLLSPIALLKVAEITVECGRADTITKEKLQVLSDMGVTRISINPQTFNEKVLSIIGRNHSVEQVIDAYKMARQFNFDINMDFIAGLPGDDYASFTFSINKALELAPDNITIHTLSIKNAGLLKHMQNAVLPSAEEVSKMLAYAQSNLVKNGFEPYYLYRQKNMLGFFENVGYSKPNKYCVFNIYSMEDLKPIIACGAGAISKKIHKENNYIERIANVKQIRDYISRFDEMLLRKDSLLS